MDARSLNTVGTILVVLPDGIEIRIFLLIPKCMRLTKAVSSTKHAGTLGCHGVSHMGCCLTHITCRADEHVASALSITASVMSTVPLIQHSLCFVWVVGVSRTPCGRPTRKVSIKVSFCGRLVFERRHGDHFHRWIVLIKGSSGTNDIILFFGQIVVFSELGVRERIPTCLPGGTTVVGGSVGQAQSRQGCRCATLPTTRSDGPTGRPFDKVGPIAGRAIAVLAVFTSVFFLFHHDRSAVGSTDTVRCVVVAAQTAGRRTESTRFGPTNMERRGVQMFVDEAQHLQRLFSDGRRGGRRGRRGTSKGRRRWQVATGTDCGRDSGHSGVLANEFVGIVRAGFRKGVSRTR
mmetsp:Transcript_30876/g.51367  ORF Transcript_30876/g.51367 Transcript_30876/m.51367 type:complete len:348 (+) Transcript_30876:1041-2084(+)